MKKSITISVAIILAVVVIALYKGAHQHLTAFDAMLFITMFFIGVWTGVRQAERPAENKNYWEVEEQEVETTYSMIKDRVTITQIQDIAASSPIHQSAFWYAVLDKAQEK